MNSALPLLRTATLADIDVILQFMRELNDFEHHPFDPSAAHRALEEFFSDPSFGVLWLICDGPRPVGYIAVTFGFSFEFRGRDAFIDEFFLLESHRHRGWGTLALQTAEDLASKYRVRALHLEVTPDNHGAFDFYRRRGFRDRGYHLMTKRLFL